MAAESCQMEAKSVGLLISNPTSRKLSNGFQSYLCLLNFYYVSSTVLSILLHKYLCGW